MKRLALVLMVVLAFGAVQAQSSKVQSCINYLKVENYKKAKTAIDAAVVHKKTADDAKAWWYHGQTYQIILSQCQDKELPEYCELAPNAMETALNSFMKAINLNWKDPKWNSLDILRNDADFQVFARLIQDKNNIDNWDITYDIAFARMNSMSIAYFNHAVNQLNSESKEENAKSLESFDISIRLSSLMRFDTLGYFYSALAAEKAEIWDEASKRYTRLIEMDYGADEQAKLLNYRSLALANLNQGDTAQYIQVLQDGAEKYSATSSVLMDMLINHYLGNDMKAEALIYLNNAIKSNPTNETYYFAIGTLHDESSEYDSAAIAYQKALEIKADFYDAIYNLGVLYNNQAVEVFTQARDLPIEKQKQYDKMMDEGKAILEKALPYMEKAYEMNPEDINTVISLKGIYYTLGNYDKSNEMKALIEAYEAKAKEGQ